MGLRYAWPALGMAIFISLPGLVGFALADTCGSCHSPSDISPNGGWSYAPPALCLVNDPILDENQTFEVRLYVLSDSVYTVSDVRGEIGGVTGDLKMKSGTKGAVRTDDRGWSYVSWTMETKGAGSASLTVNAGYSIWYTHTSGGNKDRADYTDILSTDLSIGRSSLSISPGTVILTKDFPAYEVGMIAKGQVSNLRAIVPSNMEGTLKASLTRSELAAGDAASLTISASDAAGASSTIRLSWREGGLSKSCDIKVVVVEHSKGKGGLDPYHEIGKYTGIAAFVLVVIGYFTGGTGSLKRLSNKVFGSAQRRIRFHCALSYEVLILVIFHLAVLAYGPFRSLIFKDWEIVLGESALVLMLIISLNGIFQRRVIKWWGFQNWRRIHAWGSYLATGMAAVHMLTYGTHFLWFRQLIGMV